MQNGCLQLRDSWGLAPHSLTNAPAKVVQIVRIAKQITIFFCALEVGGIIAGILESSLFRGLCVLVLVDIFLKLQR